MNVANIQAAYYMVAATGVLIAAIYYIINLRSNNRAREWEIARLHTSDILSQQGAQRYATIMDMEWQDAEDFNRKYGYSNPEMWGAWISMFWVWETHGILVKNKVIDAEKLHDLGAFAAIVGWEKFKEIVQGMRKDWGQDTFRNAEFFAQEMLKIKRRKDPSFRAENVLRGVQVPKDTLETSRTS